MRRFFISYRRDDAEAEAGRIADRFRTELGDEAVFFDTLAIDGGDLWMERIQTAVAQADVMLVVIGRSWLTLLGADGLPRIQAEQDVVAFEIAAALQRGIRVIPVRVHGTALPTAAMLPKSLAKLPGFNDIEVRSGPAFSRDVEALMHAAIGRRQGWRRWLPRGGLAWGVAGAALASVAGLSALLLVDEGGGTPVLAPPALPTAFDLQLQVKIDDSVAEDGQAPEMKLWHREPPPNGRAENVSFLDKPREISRSELAYLSPIPTMPAQNQRYEGQLHRVMRTGHANFEPMNICFKANLAAGNKAAQVRVHCDETGQACQIADDDPGWASPCAAAPKAVSSLRWLDWLPQAQAATPTVLAAASSWAVPSLQTLQRADNAGRAYSEVRLQSDALPALQTATRFEYAIVMNGQPLQIDGLPSQAYPQPFDADKGLDIRFGLENLDAAGQMGGFEDLRLQLRFYAGTQLLRTANLAMRYVALRDIDGPKRIADGDIALRWSAVYHPGATDDKYQVFITSAPVLAGLDAHKARFDQAGLSAEVAGRTLPVVAVLRPPWDKNPSYGLNVGLRLPNGQIRFTFNARESQDVCLLMQRVAARRPELVRNDSYRRSVDGRKEYKPCAGFSG